MCSISPLYSLTVKTLVCEPCLGGYVQIFAELKLVKFNQTHSD